MTGRRKISRRSVLAAGTASLGFLTLGGSVVAQARRVSFNRSQQVPVESPGNGENSGSENGENSGNGNGDAADGVFLRVDWKEWYNSEVVESQDAATGDHAPGVLTLPDITPGDRGRLAIGLSTETARGRPPSMAVSFRIREAPGSRRENGRNEPEQKAGDSTDDVGELQEYIDLDIWYDTGVQAAGNPVYGFCDAANNLGDSAFLSGTLAELSVVGTRDELGAETWRTLDTAASNPVSSDRCLGPGEGLCLTIEWAFSTDAADLNLVQGDSVSPVIEFGAVQCA